MEYPFISAKCITYGRVHTLEEALHSFLQQDYPGKKEMVIVNDYPLQKLVFDHPEVRIYNLDKTFETIGDKENYATKLCEGEIICQWDDDDIALQNHMSNVAKFMKDDKMILHWANGGYFNGTDLSSIEWIGNSGIAFRKSAWEAIGGHPIENAGYDMTFVESLHRKFPKGIIFATPPREEVSWFYMWAGRGYHMSGAGHDKPGKPNVIQRHSAHVENMRRKGLVPTGEIVLQPYWMLDYPQKLKDLLAKNKSTA